MNKIKTLTRLDLAEAITDKFQVTRFEALDFIEEVLDEVTKALVEEGTVKLTGFGTFMVRNKSARMGRNPKTKEEAFIAERKSLSFKASTMLKKKVNGEIE